MNRESGGIAEEEKRSVRGGGQAGWKGASFPQGPTPLALSLLDQDSFAARVRGSRYLGEIQPGLQAVQIKTLVALAIFRKDHGSVQVHDLHGIRLRVADVQLIRGKC